MLRPDEQTVLGHAGLTPQARATLQTTLGNRAVILEKGQQAGATAAGSGTGGTDPNGGSSSAKSIILIKFAAVAQSTKFDSTTKLALGSEYFDPNDAKWGLSVTSTATFFMLLETTNASNLAAGDLFQQTGTGSPTTVASITPTAGTTATLVSVSVSTAFRPGANAGVFTARSWITTNNANDQATCLGSWLEITP